MEKLVAKNMGTLMIYGKTGSKEHGHFDDIWEN
jgi:hypothetical protein